MTSANLDRTWDVIILGLGGVGSAAAYHLAAAGHRVLGIDPHPPVHDRGSSHGQTRIIRQAYFEHPAYVPLLRRAYELWAELENEVDEELFCRSGLVEIGPADGVVIPGVKRSAAEYDLDIEEMSMSDVTTRWSGLCGNDRSQIGDQPWQAVLEQNAGFLRVERCVHSHLSLAKQHGAVCRHGETVRQWCVDGSGVEVTTDNETLRSSRLLLACGPWSIPMLRPYGVQLQVLRKYQYWFAATTDQYELRNGMPCFFYETSNGYYYGFPAASDADVKLARHDGGQPMEAPVADRSIVDDRDADSVRAFATSHLPGISDRIVSSVPCYYTMTADEHFIVDTLPQQPQVAAIAGLSGHGFKFTGVLGEIAATRLIGESCNLDIDLFSISRWNDA